MEPTALALSALLGVVHIILAAQGSNLQRGMIYNGGPRDEAKPPLSGIPGRLDRASRNFQETFPLFAALLLAAMLREVSDWRTVWGAWLYLGARVVYLPLYAAGVFLWRSLVWNVALAGILLLAWAVIYP